MENAVVAANPTALVPAGPPGLGARWQSLPARTQLMSVLGVAALLGVLLLMFFSARDSDYRPLLPNLSEKDSSAVVDRLVQLNIPYRLAEGGTTIMVPSAQVAELRMKLSAAGLPSDRNGASSSYDLLDKNSFGQTQGAERMKFQRIKESQLVASIQSLESVKTATVMLALPGQNGFFREQSKPSASVVLTLHPGRTLDRGQIAGIVGLVASSVPELSARAVNVVDNTGALLSGGDDEGTGIGLNSQQLQYRRELEGVNLKRVNDLLEPVLGRDNFRASVNADIDFSRVEQTAEAFRPNQGADAKATVREQRSEESTQPGGASAGGVPGATSNQPPVPASAPINGAAQPLQVAQGGNGAGAAARREAATRFEVDRTITVTRNGVGTVRRLSAAVVVNNRSTTDGKGKTTTAPLSDKELEQLTALVQQGIGFNAERGDVVKVVNAPFRTETVAPADELPLWKQPWLVDLLKTFAAPAALALVALFIVAKLIRPAMTVLLAPPPPPEPGTQLDEVVGGEVPEVAIPKMPVLLPPPGEGTRVEQARAMAKANPAAVAHILRGWVNGESA